MALFCAVWCVANHHLKSSAITCAMIWLHINSDLYWEPSAILLLALMHRLSSKIPLVSNCSTFFIHSWMKIQKVINGALLKMSFIKQKTSHHLLLILLLAQKEVFLKVEMLFFRSLHINASPWTSHPVPCHFLFCQVPPVIERTTMLFLWASMSHLSCQLYTLRRLFPTPKNILSSFLNFWVFFKWLNSSGITRTDSLVKINVSLTFSWAQWWNTMVPGLGKKTVNRTEAHTMLLTCT